MTNDLISRDDAIKTLAKVGGVGHRALDVLRSLPSASVKVGEWIPCSERLPENGHYYLWCSDRGAVQSDYYWKGFENGTKYGYNIIAWMPLPKPYRGDGEA